MAITMQNLKDHMNTLINFGVMELKVLPNTYWGGESQQQGYKIEIWERDEYQVYDLDGELISDGDLTNPYNIYTDEKGVVGIIEHSHGAITMANVDAIRHLCELIGVQLRVGVK